MPGRPQSSSVVAVAKLDSIIVAYSRQEDVRHMICDDRIFEHATQWLRQGGSENLQVRAPRRCAEERERDRERFKTIYRVLKLLRKVLGFSLLQQM